MMHQKSTNQTKTNKMEATDGQIKLTIDDVQTIFNANSGNAIKNYNAGVEGDAGGA